MVYFLLKPLVRTALKLYFRRIEVRGLEAADNGAPTLILANHTASFMDALLTACYLKRRIYFFARGDVFANPIADRVLRSIGLMPVYRLSEGRHLLSENDRSNEEATRILARSGAVLIFAEGVSHTDKVLKPLKKGPFRLAVAASALVKDPIQIVPLGINYVHPARPLGDAFLEAAPAFAVSKQEAISNPVALATSLMRHTAEQLKPLAWDVQEPGLRPLADEALDLLSKRSRSFHFPETQQLLHALQQDPSGTISDQKERLEQGGHSKSQMIRILVAPFAAIGVIGHFLPIGLARWIADNKVKEPDFWAPVFVCCAIIAVLLWYLLILIAGTIAGIPGYTIGGLLLIALGGLGYLKVFRG